MGTVIAIGGMTHDIENIKNICERIIKKANKVNPRFLYIPTANNDHKEYSEYMTRFFENNYSCNTDTLWLCNSIINMEEISRKIDTADIVFVEGGNLITLLKTWSKYGVDNLLKKAYERGTIMSGISAGANCWFEQAFSDSVDGKEFDFVKGLGIVKGCICPHYNNDRRKSCFNYEIRNRNNLADIAFGIEEDKAIIIEDNRVEIIAENDTGIKGVEIIELNKIKNLKKKKKCRYK